MSGAVSTSPLFTKLRFNMVSTMHDDDDVSPEIAEIKRMEGPVTVDNFEVAIEDVPEVTKVFSHLKVRTRLRDLRMTTNQVLTALKVKGFSPIELFQALIILAELYQVMKPVVKDLVDAIMKAFGRK